MPTYDYFCEDNQQTIEVNHRMSERLQTWGELCDKAGIEPGNTSVEVKVSRLISGGSVNTCAEPIDIRSILPK